MTSMETLHIEFDALNRTYLLLRGKRASPSLLLELLDHVNNAHAAYMVELKRAIADAAAGKEVAA